MQEELAFPESWWDLRGSAFTDAEQRDAIQVIDPRRRRRPARHAATGAVANRAEDDHGTAAVAAVQVETLRECGGQASL